ncbi:response regulator [Planctomycetales bacterium ZRK34]|nr:response regulator [Planctomycetales bacterium ZRK34]
MSEYSKIKTILVVDDESHILNVLSLKLQNAGYEVVTAADGEEGFEVALQIEPDLIISDLQMPFMNGLEMCTKLKEQPATANTPALMLTARGFSLTQTDLDQTNIVGVLSKPFSPRDVLAKVQELVEDKVTQRT